MQGGREIENDLVRADSLTILDYLIESCIQTVILDAESDKPWKPWLLLQLLALIDMSHSKGVRTRCLLGRTGSWRGSGERVTGQWTMESLTPAAKSSNALPTTDAEW
jgi:hypothetical protein